MPKPNFEKKLDKICGTNFTEDERTKFGWTLQTMGMLNNTVLTADPVNVLSGNYVIQEKDLAIRGIPFLSVIRTYNSLNKTNGIFGQGWSSSYEYRLKERNSGKVSINLPDGNKNIFTITNTIIRETHIKNMYWKPHSLTD